MGSPLPVRDDSKRNLMFVGRFFSLHTFDNKDIGCSAIKTDFAIHWLVDARAKTHQDKSGIAKLPENVLPGGHVNISLRYWAVVTPSSAAVTRPHIIGKYR